MALKLEQIHIVISGRVQGVGFRYATQREAMRQGLTGWVRNTPEGTVEVVAEGPTAVIEGFLAWCHRGPTLAKVAKVMLRHREEISSPEFPRFEIR